MDVLLLILAAIGHAAFWAGTVNRLHATGLPRWGTKTLSSCCHLAMLAIPPLLVWWLVTDPVRGSDSLVTARHGAALFYLVPCWILGAVHLGRWARWRFFYRTPAALKSNHTTNVNLTDMLGRLPAGNWFGQLTLRLPLNEVLSLAEHEKTIQLARLHPALDGLSIVHATDWHITRRFDKAFYEALVARINAMDADVVAITGDLFDDATCFAWIPDTFARLRARFGVYFVLGNHDLRTRDAQGLRRTLAAAGLVDLGGRWTRQEIRGHSVVLAGNELPWIAPAADMETCPPRDADGGPLRILLSHTPDQFGWARRHDFDLMLAGHTHGGQVRFPLVGAIYCPSRFGVQYALGAFHEPPTVMHVSRGVSSKLPIRWSCPPELTKLVLTRSAAR